MLCNNLLEKEKTVIPTYINPRLPILFELGNKSWDMLKL